MTIRTEPDRRLRALLRVSALIATLAGCGNGEIHHAVIPCEGIANCKDPATAPVCAYTICTDCHATTKKCLYRAKNSPSCPCLETEISTCNMAGGAGAPTGHRECVAVSSSSTGWGGCGSL